MSSPTQVVTEQWLNQLCLLISGIQSAIVIEADAGDDAEPNLVRWPEDREAEKDLLKLAMKAAETRRQLIIPNQSHNVADSDLIAVPLVSDEQSMGSVALCLSARTAQKQKAALQALRWSMRWLKFLKIQAKNSCASGTDWIEHLAGRPVSTTAIVELLAEQLHCDRVTLALGNASRLEIAAIYPRVRIEHETGLLRAIKEAMFEAIDQQALLYYPLSIRLPLWDPDRALSAVLPLAQPLFSRVGAGLWLVLVLIGLLQAASHWHTITGNITSQLLSADNLLLMGVVYLLMKLFHVAVHGLATKYWGG